MVIISVRTYFVHNIIPYYIINVKLIMYFLTQYFSKSFTMNHIVNNVELPAEIKVVSRKKDVIKVKMVMSKAEVNGVGKGGAMITTNWSSVVQANNMKIGQHYVFWFRRSRDGGLKLLVDLL